MSNTHCPERLLVTGGAGFIGCNFVHHWLGQHPEARVVVLDALTYAGSRDNLAPVVAHPGLRFVHGDIRDQDLVEQLLREESLDTIVHFAAESHVDRSIAGPDAFIETNVIGTHALLKAARAVWLDDPATRRPAHRFHHVSTDEVYGSLGPDDPPFTETTPYAPNSPYSASKAASDHLVRAYHHTYGLRTTISNCSNNYGPYHYPEKLIPLAITRLLTGGEVPVYGDGLNVRDWLHVSDHCRGIEKILSHGQVGEVYNIGGNQERTNREIIDTLCRIVDGLFADNPELARRYPDAWPARGQSCQEAVTFVDDRPGHDRRYAIDATRMSEELGFVASGGFDDHVLDTLTWFVENKPWWTARMVSQG
ncbi:MAG: dTDP-glucose 4,6-dehydratase [Halothiobacillaceae bacterium]